MVRYDDINGDSGVYAYAYDNDYIDVQFKSTGKVYRYSYRSAGIENVEHMKALARNGDGLNSFINRVVRNLFER